MASVSAPVLASNIRYESLWLVGFDLKCRDQSIFCIDDDVA
jgi:hypothetical protein